MTPAATRVAWTALFALALLGPIAARMVTTERTGFWPEASIVTGLLATSLLAAVLVLTSRVHSITRAFGMSTVSATHRYLGLLVVAMMAAHVAAVVIGDPGNVRLLSPAAPSVAMFGMAGLIGVCALGALSGATRRGRYQRWRWGHIGLAALVLATTTTHIVLLHHLVEDPIEGALLGGMAGVVAAVLIGRWVIFPMTSGGSFVVVEVHADSPTVSTLTLRPRRTAGRMQFAAGQFAWLRTHRVPIVEHPYTISSAEQDGARPTFTFRRGGVSATTLQNLRLGDQVWLDGPHGDMTPASNAGVVLVAGGVGITPMLSILRTMARDGDARPVRVLLADRPGETLFRAELTQLQTQLTMTVTETERVPVTATTLENLLPPPFLRDRLDYFVCGPNRLIDDTTTSLSALGVPAGRVHTERFDTG